MYRWLFLVLLAALLISCGGPQVATDPTPASAPTAMPTVVTLDKIAIEPALIQSGDLPSGLVGGQVKALVPVLFKGITPPDRVLTQSLENGGVALGNVTVLLYQDTKNRDAAYTQMLGDIAITPATGGTAQPGIGERSLGGLFTNNLPGFAEIAFVRCHAVVHIRLDTQDATDVTTYAKRLDTRLQTVVC